MVCLLGLWLSDSSSDKKQNKQTVRFQTHKRFKTTLFFRKHNLSKRRLQSPEIKIIKSQWMHVAFCPNIIIAFFQSFYVFGSCIRPLAVFSSSFFKLSNWKEYTIPDWLSDSTLDLKQKQKQKTVWIKGRQTINLKDRQNTRLNNRRTHW